MKRITRNIWILLCLTSSQIVFSNPTGMFFDVDVTTTTITVKTVPNHTYPNAGVKIDTKGFSLAEVGVDCQLNASGFCLFSVSNTKPVTIAFEGIGEQVDFTLCLDGVAALTCEKHSVPITLFAGTGDGNVTKSVDNGVTWSKGAKPGSSPVTGLVALKHIYSKPLKGSNGSNGLKDSLAFDPGLGGMVLYKATEAGDFSESLDGGDNWELLARPGGIEIGLEGMIFDLAMVPIVIDSGPPNPTTKVSLDTESGAAVLGQDPYFTTMMAAAMGSGRVCFTRDFGESWDCSHSRCDGSAALSVAFMPDSNLGDGICWFSVKGLCYQAVAGMASGKMCRTKDGGDTWETMTSPFLDPDDGITALSVSKNGTLYASSGTGKVAAFDGKLWIRRASLQYALYTMLTSHSNVLYAGNSRGDVLYSEDSGLSFTYAHAQPSAGSPVNALTSVANYLG